jgi:cytochrome c biogenesis protein CcmG/thiol:disulfide interchange protein DsbE
MSSVAARKKSRARKKKRQTNRWMLALSLFLMVGGLGAILWLSLDTNTDQPAPRPAEMKEGSFAADFTLPTLGGGETSLSDYEGQVVVINFWATWCPPCKAEMPGINAFYEEHADDGLVVLAINGQEAEPTVAEFINGSNFTFPVLLDEEGEATRLFNARSFPTTFILDKSGRIQHVQIGLISEQELAAYALPLLQ